MPQARLKGTYEARKRGAWPIRTRLVQAIGLTLGLSGQAWAQDVDLGNLGNGGFRIEGH